jgi:elongator complex protein 2
LSDLPNWKLLYSVEKAHSRIIWSAKFSHDAKLIVTGSRDKTLKIWSNDKVLNLLHAHSFESGLTSVDFFHSLLDSKYILAVGFENGDIDIIEFTYFDEKLQIFKHQKLPTRFFPLI